MERVALSIGGKSPRRTAVDALTHAGAPRFRALYVHVPFCAHKCHYCDFYSIVDSEDRAEAFVERLESEMDEALKFIVEPLETVFIGGGTPTLIGESLVRRMISGLRRRFAMIDGAEFTVEANPETVNAPMARALMESGATRVSLGAQSFDPALLSTLERWHHPESVARAVGLLREAGIPSINLDLIYGIPGSTIEQWELDLDRTIALKPDHISAYGLVYEPNTPLAVKLRTGKVTKLAEELEVAQCAAACGRLAAAGFERYEISNWGRRGHRCRHNLLYWENADWWALGPSASAHASGVRWKNVPRLSDWLSEGPLASVQDIEVLDDDARVGEVFMLGLRLIDGIPLDRVESLLTVGSRGPARRHALARFTREGLLVRDASALRLSASGLLLADTVLCELV